MSSWTHIHCEAHCLFDVRSKKEHTFYDAKFVNGELKWGKKKMVKENVHYVPADKRPEWCIKENKKFTPQHRCFGCPFFASAEIDTEEVIIFEEIWEKFTEKCFKDDEIVEQEFVKLINGIRQL